MGINDYRDHPDIESCESTGYPVGHPALSLTLAHCAACGEPITEGEEVVEHEDYIIHNTTSCLSEYARHFDAVEFDDYVDDDYDIADKVREEGIIKDIYFEQVEPDLSVYDKYDYAETVPCDVIKYCDKIMKNNI